LPGHFPGHPIVPGVVLLTELLRLIEREFGAQFKVLAFPHVKFAAPLSPGEDVTVTLEKGEELAFRIMRRDTMIASGTIQYVDRPVRIRRT
jgi:3-hydroxyacyl-[acyl-carrier-protein] dehydratase